jgi:hypothetical protein
MGTGHIVWRDVIYPAIKLYLAPAWGHNAPPPGIPCHTCELLLPLYVEHLNHCQL